MTETKDLNKFHQLAKTNCCDWSLIGPNKKTNYCWGKGIKCVVLDNKFCTYFSFVVLPYKLLKQYKIEYDEIWNKINNPKPTYYRICNVKGCDNEFESKNRNQNKCPECTKKSKEK